MSAAGRIFGVITVLDIESRSRFHAHGTGRPGGRRGSAARTDVPQRDLAEALIMVHVQRREVSLYGATCRYMILQTVAFHGLLSGLLGIRELQGETRGMPFVTIERALGVCELHAVLVQDQRIPLQLFVQRFLLAGVPSESCSSMRRGVPLDSRVLDLG